MARDSELDRSLIRSYLCSRSGLSKTRNDSCQNWVLHKLDVLERPYVHKTLVTIKPLLIDEVYCACVEGREIIHNLSKAASLAHMISTRSQAALVGYSFASWQGPCAFLKAIGFIIPFVGLNIQTQLVDPLS